MNAPTTEAVPPVRRLGVIGDAHAEDERLEAALEVLAAEQVDLLVCTGDLVDGTGCPDRTVELLRDAGVVTVRGNHDRWLLEDKARQVPDAHRAEALQAKTLDYLRELPSERLIPTVAGPLLLCHGVGKSDLRKVWPGSERMPPERSKELDALIAGGQTRFMLNGHMHFRVLVHFQSLTMFNAGTLRGNHAPGFTILDFETGAAHPFTLSEGVPERVDLVPLNPTPDRRIWKDTLEFDGNWQPTRVF